MVTALAGTEAVTHADLVRDAFPRFKTAFAPEYSSGPLAFVPQERAYYIVSHNGRPECLVAVHFDRSSNSFEATISFARIVLKDKYAADGWWYVLEVLNHAIRPRGVKIVQAHLETKGSRKTFNDLYAKFPFAVSIVEPLALIDLELLPAPEK